MRPTKYHLFAAVIAIVMLAGPARADDAASKPQFGRYWQLQGAICEQTPEGFRIEHLLDYTVHDNNHALEQSLHDMDTEYKNCTIQSNANSAAAYTKSELEDQSREDAIERQHAQNAENAERAAEHVAERATEFAAERARQTALQEKRKEVQQDAKIASENIKALALRRRDVLLAMSRCVNKLSSIDCGTARVESFENYQADIQLHDNTMLCVDRSQQVTAILYQAQLTNNGYIRNWYDSAVLDAMLGQLIDDCPNKSEWALNIRRTMHNL